MEAVRVAAAQKTEASESRAAMGLRSGEVGEQTGRAKAANKTAQAAPAPSLPSPWLPALPQAARETAGEGNAEAVRDAASAQAAAVEAGLPVEAGRGATDAEVRQLRAALALAQQQAGEATARASRQAALLMRLSAAAEGAAAERLTRGAQEARAESARRALSAEAAALGAAALRAEGRVDALALARDEARREAELWRRRLVESRRRGWALAAKLVKAQERATGAGPASSGATAVGNLHPRAALFVLSSGSPLEPEGLGCSARGGASAEEGEEVWRALEAAAALLAGASAAAHAAGLACLAHDLRSEEERATRLAGEARGLSSRLDAARLWGEAEAEGAEERLRWLRAALADEQRASGALRLELAAQREQCASLQRGRFAAALAASARAEGRGRLRALLEDEAAAKPALMQRTGWGLPREGGPADGVASYAAATCDSAWGRVSDDVSDPEPQRRRL